MIWRVDINGINMFDGVLMGGRDNAVFREGERLGME
jgi:hypothetical protein